MAWLKYAGYGFEAAGHLSSGLSGAAIGKSQAMQLRDRANTRRGIAQREANRERELGGRVVKRAIVDILAQGGTTDDAGGVALLADLEAEKEYRAMSLMYVGEDEAAGMEHQALIAAAEGKASKLAGYMGAASTVMKGAGEWFEANPRTKKITNTPPIKGTNYAQTGGYSAVQGRVNPITGKKGPSGFSPVPKGQSMLEKAIGPRKAKSVFMEGKKPAGMTEIGNIDIANRPDVPSPDGKGRSSIYSMGIQVKKGGLEILIPRVAEDGTIMSVAEAIAQYKRTGKHLGKFKTPAQATAYAKYLSLQQKTTNANSGWRIR